MISSKFNNMNDAPLRHVKGKVELYKDSTLLETFAHTDKLQEFSVSRLGEHGKFFGFGVCQQATVKIVDKQGTLQFEKGDELRIHFNGDETEDFIKVFPSFYINNTQRDEKTNVITLVAYDIIDKAASHTVSELNLTPPYTIRNVAEAIADFLGLRLITDTPYLPDTLFLLNYPEGANFGGDETLRAVLNAIAEATQTIYYVSHDGKLIFKILNREANPVLCIDKSNYFELTTALPVTISKIVHATELGDNVESGQEDGITQYVRDNPFWNMRTDLYEILPTAIERIKGLTIVPYTLRWRGMFTTEICDKICFEAKDGTLVTSYLLSDTITYTGGMSENSSWEYNPENDRGTSANPVTLGEKLNQTFAKVDKVNKTVTLYASSIEETRESIGELEVTSKEISASVSSMEQRVGDTSDKIENLYSEVSTKLDKDGVEITIEEKLADGVEKVVTASKKYTFDDSGLKVSSSSNNISTTITENGMRIYRSGKEVLTANNEGVKAEDLHATTYLIIGNTSRLEDYNNRTTCYWIGD
jgi:hypothetical protein